MRAGECRAKLLMVGLIARLTHRDGRDDRDLRRNSLDGAPVGDRGTAGSASCCDGRLRHDALTVAVRQLARGNTADESIASLTTSNLVSPCSRKILTTRPLPAASDAAFATGCDSLNGFHAALAELCVRWMSFAHASGFVRSTSPVSVSRAFVTSG